MKEPINRSSVEFFIGFLSAVFIVVWPMTWWFQIILMMICIGIIIHLVNGSPLTYKWRNLAKIIFSFSSVLIFGIISCNPVIDQWNKDHSTNIRKIDFSGKIIEILNIDTPLWIVLILAFLSMSILCIILTTKKQANKEKEDESEFDIKDYIELKPRSNGITVFYDRETITIYFMLINLSVIDFEIQKLSTRIEDFPEDNNFTCVDGILVKRHSIKIIWHERSLTQREKNILCDKTSQCKDVTINCSLSFLVNGKSEKKGFTEHGLLRCANQTLENAAIQETRNKNPFDEWNKS